jgi:YHYH protein
MIPPLRHLALPLAILAGLATGASALAHDIDLKRLPLGDGKVSSEPKVGWVWACHVESEGGGARVDGPWIDKSSGTFDFTAKTVVRGSVTWPHRFTIALHDDVRVFTSNDLPAHPTGQFPIAPDDPAYRYDTNPNRIGTKDFQFTLPALPQLAPQAQCAPGAVGILLSGVMVFNALDLPGRDAVAHETQDLCQGHPQRGGVYHYHSLSSCIDDKPGPDGNSKLVGYALDGFGIFGGFENGRRLATADLDACHGRTSEIEWDGRKRVMYHYVATADFPYTVGCLRGTVDRSLLRRLMGAPPAGRMGRPPPPLGRGR